MSEGAGGQRTPVRAVLRQRFQARADGFLADQFLPCFRAFLWSRRPEANLEISLRKKCVHCAHCGLTLNGIFTKTDVRFSARKTRPLVLPRTLITKMATIPPHYTTARSKPGSYFGAFVPMLVIGTIDNPPDSRNTAQAGKGKDVSL